MNVLDVFCSLNVSFCFVPHVLLLKKFQNKSQADDDGNLTTQTSEVTDLKPF